MTIITLNPENPFPINFNACEEAFFETLARVQRGRLDPVIIGRLRVVQSTEVDKAWSNAKVAAEQIQSSNVLYHLQGMMEHYSTQYAYYLFLDTSGQVNPWLLNRQTPFLVSSFRDILKQQHREVSRQLYDLFLATAMKEETKKEVEAKAAQEKLLLQLRMENEKLRTFDGDLLYRNLPQALKMAHSDTTEALKMAMDANQQNYTFAGQIFPEALQAIRGAASATVQNNTLAVEEFKKAQKRRTIRTVVVIVAIIIIIIALWLCGFTAAAHL